MSGDRNEKTAAQGNETSHPYATLHKHLQRKSGTVHASYLHEAHVHFTTTGTPWLPAAAPPPGVPDPTTHIPGVGAATAPGAVPYSTTPAPPVNPPQSSQPTSHAAAANHIVPFHGQWGGQRGPHAHGTDIPTDYRDVDDADARPILLFDLNGTITSHTAKRRSSGINKPRPGVHHLRRLLDHYRLGVFTSSTLRTVQTAIAMLERAAGPGAPLFPNPRLVLYRDHTMMVPPHHVHRGGKSWDTVKPLHPYFSKLNRVLLIDDDAFKACPGQESNMVLVPVWNQHKEDDVIRVMVDVLLQAATDLSPTTDLRGMSQNIQAQLWTGSGRTAEDAAQQAQQGEDSIVAVDDGEDDGDTPNPTNTHTATSAGWAQGRVGSHKRGADGNVVLGKVLGATSSVGSP